MLRRRLSLVLLVSMLAASAGFQANDRARGLSFSDPANVPAPPAGSIGFPSRDPGFDAKPGFKSPPPGYGEVAFFWWLGDPLTRERLAWHLDQLKGRGVTGLQINYAHSDKGGVSYGLSMPSDPPIFSPAWWELVQWFAAEAYKRGMSISLSDYTLGLGNKIVPLSAEENSRWKKAVRPIIDEYIKEVSAKGLPADKAVKDVEGLIQKYAKTYR
jgi:hypothetical protein